MACICNGTGIDQKTHIICSMCNGTPEQEIHESPIVAHEEKPVAAKKVSKKK